MPSLCGIYGYEHPSYFWRPFEVMLQLSHPYLYLLFPRGMYTGSSFVTPSSVSLTIVMSPSSSCCSSFTGVVGVGVGIGVEVGVVISFSDLRSCGNSPVPTSKHVFSKSSHRRSFCVQLPQCRLLQHTIICVVCISSLLTPLT